MANARGRGNDKRTAKIPVIVCEEISAGSAVFPSDGLFVLGQADHDLTASATSVRTFHMAFKRHRLLTVDGSGRG